jgi:hypothetical protein
MKKVLLLSMLCFLPFSSVQADVRWFFGGGAGLVTFDDSVDEVEPINGLVRAGLGVNQYFDIGIERSVTVIDDDIDGVDFDVDMTFIFVKGNLPINDTTKLYLMVGKADVEITGSLGNFSASFDDSDTAFGVGLQFESGESGGYFVDYISYYDDSEFDGVAADITTDSLNFGYIAYF